MAVSRLGPMPAFSTIGRPERANLLRTLGRPLSGYLGGVDAAGYWVERLSKEWADRFGVKHAVPCNSATSGLLAACRAAGIGPGDEVWCSSYTMSASASCAMVLGASVTFRDIEDVTYSMTFPDASEVLVAPKAIIVTNLFGHPARLAEIRAYCDKHGIVMIEDNAQAPFAMEGNRYAGTIGHIGVFSLNVHKHIQCGEGGVVVTTDERLGELLRQAINHGELAGGQPGLNLRITEPIAAIACAQLDRADQAIQSRINLAHEITLMFADTPVMLPIPREGCKHVFYIWAGEIAASPYKRRQFVAGLNKRGVPFREGYITPLHQLFNAGYSLPEVERVESDIITFEICAYDPKSAHLKKMRKIIQEEAEEVFG